MACTYRTSVAGGSSTGTANRTVAITPAVNDLFVVFVIVAANTNNTPTVTDNNGSGTYDRIWVVPIVIGAVNYRVSCHVRTALLPNTTSTTVTANTGSNTSGSIVCVAVAGSPNAGATAVRQSATQSDQAAGTPAPTFPANALTGNMCLGQVGNGTNPATMTIPSGWAAERHDVGFASDTLGHHIVTRDSGFTGTTVTWGSASASRFASGVLELHTVLQVTGSGSGALSPFDGSGAGTEAMSGSGSGALSPFDGSGSATETISGSGSGAMQPFDASGSGTHTEGGGSVEGSGSGALSSFDGSGSGAEEMSGSGSGALQPLGGSGSGQETISGSGSGALPAIGGTGSATETISGSGSGAMSPVAGSGSSSVANPVSGSGTGALSSVEGSGTGGSGDVVSGSGSGALAPLSGSGNATEGMSGSGSGALSSFGGTGTGSEGFIGVGSGALSPFAGLGLATESLSGAGSGALQGFGGSGAGIGGVDDGPVLIGVQPELPFVLISIIFQPSPPRIDAIVPVQPKPQGGKTERT